jgi:hypothetical protein
MEKIKFDENEIIIRLGDTSEHVYVIIEGEVGIYLLDKFYETNCNNFIHHFILHNLIDTPIKCLYLNKCI